MSKKHWKNLTENLSLQFKTKGSWSQEENDTPADEVNNIRSILPTKTSATRQISDLESINPNGPFLLNFSNVPFEATEADLKNFFRNFDILNIIRGDQRRRNGIIEFKDLNGLTGALSMNDKHFINRSIKLSIANKDDLTRMKSGGGQQNRFQNQQRTQQSTISEDSDNWRVRKAQPVTHTPVDNYNSNKEKTNWREKTPRVSDDKLPVDSTENWRRPKLPESRGGPAKDVKSGNFNRPNMPIQDSSARSPISSQTPESKDGDQVKKVSIFGEAKPVDTTAKDMEIEMKIEQSKKHTGDESETSNAPKNTAWNNKKPSNPPISPAGTTEKPSTGMEWRMQKGSQGSRSKTNSESQREPAPKSEQPAPEPPVKNPEPIPAPIPKNVWVERMKSKSGSVSAPEERNNNAPKVVEKPVEIVEPVATGNNSSSNQAEKVIQKPPVVISVNGPFLDPKSRTPHHSMSDNSYKTPTAVPVSKSFDSKPVDPLTSKPSCPESKSVPAKACGTQSSWSKGPPKGLIDRVEMNQ